MLYLVLSITAYINVETYTVSAQRLAIFTSFVVKSLQI